MAISSISPASVITATPSAPQQRRNEFNQLAQALQSGDLGAAESSYNALAQSASAQLQQASNSPLGQDFAQLGQALQAGDLTGARQAFANLQQQAASSQSSNAPAAAPAPARGHHGHHHHRTQTETATTTPSANSTATDDANQLLTSGNIVNLTA